MHTLRRAITGAYGAACCAFSPRAGLDGLSADRRFHLTYGWAGRAAAARWLPEHPPHELPLCLPQPSPFRQRQQQRWFACGLPPPAPFTVRTVARNANGCTTRVKDSRDQTRSCDQPNWFADPHSARECPSCSCPGPRLPLVPRVCRRWIRAFFSRHDPNPPPAEFFAALPGPSPGVSRTVDSVVAA